MAVQVREARSTTTIAVAGAATLLANALVHFQLYPEHTNAEHAEMGHAYIGQLFLLGTVVLVIAALGVARDSRAYWHLGALTNAVMLALLLASRYTYLLPNGYHEAWEPAAVVTLVLEVAFLALYAGRLVSNNNKGGEYA